MYYTINKAYCYKQDQLVQWASLSDVPQMDTKFPKFGTEPGFNILNTILVSTPKFQTETSSAEQMRNGRQNGRYREMRTSQFCE